MKLSKKILAAFSVAAMLVTAASFVGCKDEDDEEDAFSGGTVKFDNSYVTVTTAADGTVTVKNAKEGATGATENTTYYYRAFKKTTTKHRGGIVEVTINPNSNASDASPYDGVQGYVFDLVDGENDTYSFIVAALRWDVKNNELGTYISQYKNVLIKSNNFTTEQNFTDVNGINIGETDCDATEVELLKGDSTVYKTLAPGAYTKNDDGSITVTVKVVQDEDGGYYVGYYKDASVAKEDGETSFENANYVPEYTNGADADDKSKISNAYTSNAEEKKLNQRKLAYYANIYPGKVMNAKFSFAKTYGEAAIAIEGNPNVISE